jgi:alpha-galactosidase
VSVHGDHPDPAIEVHGVVAEDGSDAVFAIVALATSQLYPPGAVRLPGLADDRSYHVRPLAPGDVPDGTGHNWGVQLPWWKPEGVTLPGRVLGTAGVQAPVLHPERLVLVRATAV